MIGNRHAVVSQSRVPDVHKPRSKFDLSHTIKTTAGFDYLIPIYLQEVLPGDTFHLNTTVFARLATQVVPLMDNLYSDFFYFFVPNRLVWDNWQKFMGEQDNPADFTDYEIPTLTASNTTGFTAGSIYDYFGLPTEINSLEVNALPFRGYNLIWNQWFRNENTDQTVTVNKGDGPDLPGTYGLLFRARRHDRYSSGLPWPQKGDPISLPTSDTPATVSGIGVLSGASWSTTDRTVWESGASATTTYSDNIATSNANEIFILRDTVNTNRPKIEVDISSALGTINDLREAWMIQSLLEIDARHGTRYIESIYGHFGVVSSDARLQRSEYLGGGEVRFNTHPIPQTSQTDTSPQGTLSAYTTAVNRGSIGFSKTFEEHGMIIGVCAARADITYQQGVTNKFWLKRSRYDFYWPALANLGEQPITNIEIYAQGPAAVNPSTSIPYDDEVFCYQEAWSDYRYFTSLICGDFRSNFVTSLDAWHMADDYSSLPSLDSNWMASNTPIDRNIAVNPTGFSTAIILYDIFHSIKASRVMPTHSIPAQIGRF